MKLFIENREMPILYKDSGLRPENKTLTVPKVSVVFRSCEAKCFSFAALLSGKRKESFLCASSEAGGKIYNFARPFWTRAALEIFLKMFKEINE